MIKIDENDPIGEVDPSFPCRDVVIRKNTDMKEFYDLQKEIGRGKFGTVYRCTEKSTGLKLAAKFIGISKRQDRRNAEREVEIMRELQHPRLIQMYDAFEINNIMCVVLELIEGGELFERVIDDDFILTEKSVSVFMRQICEGIAFIHSKNILHLDMKPENILCLTRTGNRIKIIDFGLARKYDPEKKLQVLFGTPEFVAPEVVNFDSIGFGTDMWSVGVICYVLLSGLSPFMGETDVQTMANVTIAQYDYDDEAFNDISTDAKDFIGKLLLKDREQRMSATECLSHRWLQRRKPPVSSNSPPIPNSQSELDLQKDTLRYLVDRWNNDTNISLVVNNEDDKCDKVIDIGKMNGITEQRSKLQDEFVCKPNSMAAKDTPKSPIEEKSKKEEKTTLVPIQSIEAPPVSNQVLKSLPDVTSRDKSTLNLNKRSLSPDTTKVESGGKEHSAKISKSASVSRSGSSSPAIREESILLNGDAENDQELPKPSLLEVPKKTLQKQSSEVNKSQSTSPKPTKKTPVKTPSPSIKDQQPDYQAESAKEQSSQKIPKSSSSLEIPKKLPRAESADKIKSPSVSPTPGKKTPVKTPSPSIKDQDEPMPDLEEITKEQSSQKLPKSPSSLEIPKKHSLVESADKTKSPSTSPKPTKKTPVKTPSPSIKDQEPDFPIEPKPSQVEITNEKSSQKLPRSPSLLEIPKKLPRVESADKIKSPSTSPTPLKKTPVKTPSPPVKDQQPDFPNEPIPNKVEITNEKSSQELPKPSLLELPKKSAQTEPSNVKKSPSTSPKPLKKKPAKTPSPSIQDQESDHQPTDSLMLEKSSQRNIPSGKKSPTPQPTINFAKVSVSEFKEEVVDKPLTPDAEICDTVIGDKTNKSLNEVRETVSKSKKESNAQDSKNIRSSPTAGAEFAQGNDTKSNLRDIPSADPTSQSQSSRTPTVEISDETYEYVKKRRFTIKSVESTKTVDTGDSTSHTKSIEKSTTTETSPQPHRRSIFSPEVSPKVLRKINDFVSTSELMKRRISDISNLLSRRSEHDVEQSIPDEMSSFCSKLNRIVRLRHDSYSMDGSTNFKRPKFRISYFSRDVPLASTPPLHADLLNYLPFGDESIETPVWSFQKTNPFHSDPSSLRNSPERFASPSLTKKLLSKFFNDSLEYDISSTPSTSTNGLPKDKITGIIS